MKPQLAKKRPKAASAGGDESAAACLQEELSAAIHGAFEVAVEIAVREVTKLVGQATADVCEEMRRENQSLKQRLQRAEALLEERGGGGGSPSPPAKKLLNATDRADHPSIYNPKIPKPQISKVHISVTGVRGDSPPPAGHSRALQPPDDQQRQHVEQMCDVKTQHGSDAASESDGDDGCAVAFTKEEVSEGISRMCVVRVERINQPCQQLAAQDRNSPPLPSTVKQEEEDSACYLDSIKVEDFSPDCMSAVQSKMLEEWKPEALDMQIQDSDAALSCTTRLAQEFPNIFQLAEPAPIPEAPPQVQEAHVRTSRNLGHTFANLYTCKSCNQTFNLPSLLRRHYGQCQQRLQQYGQQPVDGSKRTRLQLYPPGCSPFRCTECNREFNRMENLKTHFRIHTGERPYTCAVCSKCFRHSGALTRHFRIHTGEKPYICGQCGKSFTNCGGLKFHQRSHCKQLQ
ncbi:zinc finger protein 79 [Sebastes umbrosus]|uniref:zinc finger protein 79 n=1 Tax=Sebastes umbrosus TaxID=72105 RepID=UPI00189F3FCE|nr:zinc finger protein 79 [Sebastes umbrosus]